MRTRQLLAVFRMELSKSFFSRRGLWIYLLALVPILIWAGHMLDRRQDEARNRRFAASNPGVSAEKLGSIQTQMDREEVIRILGEPAAKMRIGGRRSNRELLRYSDGVGQWDIYTREGKVTSIRKKDECNLAEEQKIFAGVFQFFYVRLAIFFGCVFVFMNLFRGEILDKSLHYYFLAPVRREIVVAGKYLAGLTATIVIFGTSTLLQMAIFSWHFPGSAFDEYVTRGPAIQHTLSYLGVAALACVGYGSVFLASGLILKNPLIPAVTIQVWESINGILPAVLRKFSIIYYLKSLCPVDVPVGRDVPPPIALLALNVEPAPVAVAVFGLLAVAAGLLYLSARKVRSLEISYGAD